MVNKLIELAEVLEKISSALMSKRALGKEWLKTEEDKAWKDL